MYRRFLNNVSTNLTEILTIQKFTLKDSKIILQHKFKTWILMCFVLVAKNSFLILTLIIMFNYANLSRIKMKCSI